MYFSSVRIQFWQKKFGEKSAAVEKLINHEEPGQVNEQVDVIEDEQFPVGEITALRETDSYNFNLLQVTNEYNINPS